MNYEKLLNILDKEQQTELFNLLLDTKLSKIDSEDKKDLILESIEFIWGKNENFIAEYSGYESLQLVNLDNYDFHQELKEDPEQLDKLLCKCFNPGYKVVYPVTLQGEQEIEGLKESYNIKVF